MQLVDCSQCNCSLEFDLQATSRAKFYGILDCSHRVGACFSILADPMAHCVADAMTFSVRFFYLIQVVDRMMGNYGSLYAKCTSAVGIAE